MDRNQSGKIFQGRHADRPARSLLPEPPLQLHHAAFRAPSEHLLRDVEEERAQRVPFCTGHEEFERGF